ncbi:MAG: CRISPR-associated endoribonuclease Cas6, partial [Campylobacterota bacterium]
MDYLELKCTAYLKQNIGFKQSFEAIAKYINFTLARSGYKQLHEARGFKYYVFGGFLPLEDDKTYKAGNTYEFTIRSLDAKLIQSLEQSLRENIDNPLFQVLQTQSRSVKQFFVSELYSATPVIVTTQNKRYWTP